MGVGYEWNAYRCPEQLLSKNGLQILHTELAQFRPNWLIHKGKGRGVNVQNQKGINAIQRCSFEKHKGAIELQRLLS